MCVCVCVCVCVGVCVGVCVCVCVDLNYVYIQSFLCVFLNNCASCIFVFNLITMHGTFQI